MVTRVLVVVALLVVAILAYVVGYNQPMCDLASEDSIAQHCDYRDGHYYRK